MAADYLQGKKSHAMINCFETSRGQCFGQEEVVVVCFWHLDVDNWGVVDMLVLAELRQSGSLPCLWRYLGKAGAGLELPCGSRAGADRRNVMAGPGLRYVLWSESVIT